MKKYILEESEGMYLNQVENTDSVLQNDVIYFLRQG